VKSYLISSPQAGHLKIPVSPGICHKFHSTPVSFSGNENRKEISMPSPEDVEDLDLFEKYRPLMFSIAYRMLGSVSEAEDMLQNAYIRYHQIEASTVASPKAFLTTMVTRLCLNHLQTIRVQRESYLGPWLPEPLLTEDDPESPTSQAEKLESISMAFLVLLERLTPVERAVFLLREVFDYPYADIAAIVGKDEVSCRQILSRAKKFIAAQRPRFAPSTEHHHQLLQQFLDAVQEGDIAGLTQLLTSDVTLSTDGGGKVRGAATRVLHGPEAVAKFMIATTRRYIQMISTIEITEANGEPAIMIRIDGHLFTVISITIAQQHIVEIRAIGNPDKLRHIE
jgi:RNA polymerase sigma-70 factor (ECF subfamily)